MVFATAQTTDALLQGIRCNRTVVKLQGPDDPMIDLQTTPERSCDTVSAAVGGAVVLRATITSGVGLRAHFLKDGYDDGDVIDIDADPFVVERTITSAGPPATSERWRVEVRDGDTPRVVTGHVWLRAVASDEGPSCGCRGGGDVALPLCAVLSLVARRRRIHRTTG